MRPGYHRKTHSNAVHLPLRLLRQVISTIQRRASNSLRILVETSAAFGVLVAASERLLAVDAAGGVCVPASSGVCGVGLAVAGEGVDEGVGVLAGAFGFLLRGGLVLMLILMLLGVWWSAYTALVQSTLELVGCVFS